MEPKDRQTQPDARSQNRAYVLDHVVAGSLTLDQAVKVLGLSTRQVNRLIARHADGSAGSPTAIGAGRPPTGLTTSSGVAWSTWPRRPTSA